MIGQVDIFNPVSSQDWKHFLTNLCGKDSQGIFLMVGENTSFDFEAVSPLFKELGVPVFGGVFPGVIYENTWHGEGVVGCSIIRPVSLQVVRNLGSYEGLAESKMYGPARTFLIIVDAMASNISSFLGLLYETHRGKVNFIGGGAGRLMLDSEPVLFTAEEYYTGGALLIEIQCCVGVGVTHGWEPMFGPLVANRTSGNALIELNWEPALINYSEILGEKFGTKINQHNFFEFAKHHPFGMVKIDENIVVRDPIRIDEYNNIILVGGEVPENSVLMILKGNPASLIKAAGEAASTAQARFEEHTGNTGQGALVINCISRVLYLGDDMARELRTIRSNIPTDLCVFGFLSLGEIASYGDRYIEFYNKTTVIGVG